MADTVTLGGGGVDGYFGKNPDWSKIKVKTGRTIWSSYDDNTLQAWLVEDTNSGGVALAGGNYANPIQIAGNGLPRIAGYFIDGFVFENPNQVGIDASGNSWQYVGTSPLPYAVPELTVPSTPDYELVFTNDHNNLTNRNAVGAHDAEAISTQQGVDVQSIINPLNVKISSIASDSHNYTDETENTTLINSAIQLAKQSSSNVELDINNTVLPVNSLTDFEDVKFLTFNKCFIQSFGTLSFYKVYDLSGFGQGAFEIPFTLREPLNISVGDNKTYSDLDWDDLLNKDAGTQTYYVIGQRPKTAPEDGLTIASGFSRITDALAQPDCGEIILTENEYDRTNSTASIPANTLDKKIIIRSIAKYGSVLSSKERFSNLTWLPDGDIYTCVRSNTGRVLDNEFSDGYISDSVDRKLELNLVGSVQEVRDTPNSWFLDGSNNLYVRTIDDRQPDENIHVLLNVDMFFGTTTGGIVVTQNIRTEGFTYGFRVDGAGGSVYARRSQFNYSSSSNARGGLSLEGVDFVAEDCGASFNAQDGFSYHPATANSSIGSQGYEFNCFGYYNGNYSIGANFSRHNCSTGHANCRVARFNCFYQGSLGPTVVDVGGGNFAYNYRVVSGGSNMEVVGNGDSRPFENTAGSKGWYDNCTGYGGNVLTDTASFTDSEIKYRNLNITGVFEGNSRKFIQF